MRLNLWKTALFVPAMAVAIGASIYAQTPGPQAQSQQGRAQTLPPAGAGRQGGQAPRPPQNLQVLPKDTTAQQIQTTMKGFTTALGVECAHCHVSQDDRASDAKPQKVMARKMMLMLAAINNDLLKGVGEPPPAGASKVTCYTCHRGAIKPLASAGG